MSEARYFLLPAYGEERRITKLTGSSECVWCSSTQSFRVWSLRWVTGGGAANVNIFIAASEGVRFL